MGPNQGFAQRPELLRIEELALGGHGIVPDRCGWIRTGWIEVAVVTGIGQHGAEMAQSRIGPTRSGAGVGVKPVCDLGRPETVKGRVAKGWKQLCVQTSFWRPCRAAMPPPHLDLFKAI